MPKSLQPVNHLRPRDAEQSRRRRQVAFRALDRLLQQHRLDLLERDVVAGAALAQQDERLVEEIADLAYHTLVLMAARGVSPEQVRAELERRHR